MAKTIFLDTHVVVWLYNGDAERFPRRAYHLIQSSPLCVSPAVLLELQYLYEIKRITIDGNQVINTLRKDIGLDYAAARFIEVMAEAIKQSWTRNPFDRMITAHAALDRSTLISKDEIIHRHYRHTVWD